MDEQSKAYLKSLNVNPDAKYRPGDRWFGANHIYFIVNADGVPQVQQIPLPTPNMGADGKWTQSEYPDAPEELRAPGYNRTPKGAYGDGVYSHPEPRASYLKPDGTSDGTVVKAGWLPGNRWVDLDGTIYSRQYSEGEPGAGGAGVSDPLTALMTAAVNFGRSLGEK